jgi:signal transduction histidine kinase
MPSKSRKTPPSRNVSALPLPPVAILNDLSVGIIVYDHTGQPVYVNPALLQLLGREATSTDPGMLTPEDLAALAELRAPDSDLTTAPSDPAAHVQWTGKRTLLVRRADDSQSVIDISPTPLRDPTSGEVVGAVHACASVTTWYEQDATKEEFLSIASHELRAPLQPILLASRTIQRWIDRPEHRAELSTLADQIVAQSKRLSQLVLDMINMTRINAGVFVIEPAPTDLASIVRDVVAEQANLTRRDITLTGADDPLPLAGEDEKLWQALTNLINNAIKYSPAPAPVTVTVSRFTEADGAPWVRVAVRDQGVGIPADQVEHVFDRFYRASISKGMERQQQDGLGLGLYITRAIILGHGGRIYAAATLGEGSTFTIELPLRKEDGA